SNAQRVPIVDSHRRIAFSSMASKTGVRSPSEELMTCSTSEVAVCCSRASDSSRVRALTCRCRSVGIELIGRLAVGRLFRLGLGLGLVLLPCRVFSGLRFLV